MTGLNFPAAMSALLNGGSIRRRTWLPVPLTVAQRTSGGGMRAYVESDKGTRKPMMHHATGVSEYRPTPGDMIATDWEAGFAPAAAGKVEP